MSPRVVLFHGMGWDGSQFDPIRPLVPNLVTPTLTGRSLKEMVDEAAAGIEDGDVVGGVSMGSAVSLAYAAEPGARCSRLVLIAPGGGDDAARYLDWLADTLEAGGFDALRAAGEPLVDFWQEHFTPDYLLTLWRSRPWVDLAAVDVPATVVAWRGDGLHPFEAAEALAAELNAELLEVPTPVDLQLPAEVVSAL